MKYLILLIILIPFALGEVTTDGNNNFQFEIDSIATTNSNFKTSEGIIATDGINTLYINTFYENLYDLPPTMYSTDIYRSGVKEVRCKETEDCNIKFTIQDNFCLNDKNLIVKIRDEIDNQIYYENNLTILSNTTDKCNYETGIFIGTSSGSFDFIVSYIDERFQTLNYNESFTMSAQVQSSSSYTPDVVTEEEINETINETVIEEIVEEDLGFFEKTLIEIPFSKMSFISKDLESKSIKINLYMISIIFLIIILVWIVKYIKNE